MNSVGKVHLAKYLKNYGNYTKSELKKLIEEKRVLVNGVLKPLSYIVKENDEILVDGQRIIQIPNVYYLYYKPVGIVCTNNLQIKDNIITHLNLPYRVFTVGRLDKNTSGLIILTNDGIFANKLMNPNNHIEKEYLVEVKNPITDEFLTTLKMPLLLRGKKTTTPKIAVVDEYHLKIIINEGKYHQIRRMVINASNYLVSLTRIRIGPYVLGNLKSDELRKITKGKRYEKD